MAYGSPGGTLGGLRCQRCGSTLDRTKIRLVGRRGDDRYLRYWCDACGATGVSVAVIHQVSPETRRRPPITEEDVLDAHDLLRDFTGDVYALFGPIALGSR